MTTDWIPREDQIKRIICGNQRDMARVISIARRLRAWRITRRGRAGERWYECEPRPRAEWTTIALKLVKIIQESAGQLDSESVESDS
jgi:hypothetical protein